MFRSERPMVVRASIIPATLFAGHASECSIAELTSENELVRITRHIIRLAFQLYR